MITIITLKMIVMRSNESCSLCNRNEKLNKFFTINEFCKKSYNSVKRILPVFAFSIA